MMRSRVYKFFCGKDKKTPLRLVRDLTWVFNSLNAESIEQKEEFREGGTGASILDENYVLPGKGAEIGRIQVVVSTEQMLSTGSEGYSHGVVRIERYQPDNLTCQKLNRLLEPLVEIYS